MVSIKIESRKLQDQAKKILEKNWNLLSIGTVGVVRNPNNSKKLSYWLIVEFIGKQKNKKAKFLQEKPKVK